MSEWMRLTAPSGAPVWVRLAAFVQMNEGEFCEVGKITTRLWTGHLGHAANDGFSSVEFFAVDVRETPEEIIAKSEERS